ncbi:unnamed protein product [Moneuplotes crassus]|uniref:Centrosomal protein of 44 kDa n=1 Tax=Euplotes crassus TaxID=5936 RepID=A0AAD1UIR1_EUPCR|nr:unnamed protein product [Moneuplotes crassus]
MSIEQSNNFRKLIEKLRKIKPPFELKIDDLKKGKPSVYLPIINYILLDFSPEMADMLLDKGYNIYGKADLKFMEDVEKICLNLFQFKPPVNIKQFFSEKFVDQKCHYVCEIIDHVKKSLKAKVPQKPKPAPRVNHGIDAKGIFKERSSSLKHPTKVEMKESIKNFKKNHEEEKGYFGYQQKNSNQYHNPKSNQSYCFPPKPPKMSHHENSKENINPNASMDYKHYIKESSNIPLSAAHHKYHPMVTASQSNKVSTDKLHSAPPEPSELPERRSIKSKRSRSRRKHKINTDNEIKIANPYDQVNNFRPQMDPDDCDSNFSEHTAVNLSQTKKDVPSMLTSDSDFPTPHFEQRDKEKYVTMEEHQKLVGQYNELKMAMNTLTETFSKFVAENNKNMQLFNGVINNMGAEITLQKSKTRYLEQRMNNQ